LRAEEAEVEVLRQQVAVQAMPDPDAEGGSAARGIYGQEAQAGEDQQAVQGRLTPHVEE
jgi:hypothetical protein